MAENLGMSDYEATEFAIRAAEIVDLGHAFHAHGWVVATSGNFSSRLRLPHGDVVAVTTSGGDKGALTTADVMLVDLAGNPLEPAGGLPSAETRLHCQLYRRSAAIGSVVHVHAPAATVLSRLAATRGELRIKGYEMLKALSGVITHEHDERVPIFANTQDVGRLAREVDALMDADPAIHGYLIAGHGLYTWGKDASEARRHAEAFEFLFDCELRARSLR
jgi:methylthioribulose-1-phosphate dehydratase